VSLLDVYIPPFRCEKWILMKKVMLPLVFALAASMIAIPALAAIEEHAKLDGRGYIKVDGQRYRGKGSIQILTVTDGYHGFEKPEFAVLMTIDGESFAWHVTKIREKYGGKVLVVKAEPHPLEGTITPDYPIRLWVYHNPDNPFIHVIGRRTFFIAK
jgi:hypothetical protein